MTKAAITYLKYLFQPYGTMMTVVELGIMAGKKITALRLDPVFFAAGSAELSTAAVIYVERVAELMKTRPQIRIRLCGLATAADTGIKNEPATKKEPVQPTKPEEVPETSKTEPFPEKVQPLSDDQGQLRELVRERSERIKEYLVKNYGIEDDRLLVCQPEYDPREDAKPRVELLI
jgi:outer membrane protein OmpA-like peptidoglycan-associated protein